MVKQQAHCDGRSCPIISLLQADYAEAIVSCRYGTVSSTVCLARGSTSFVQHDGKLALDQLC